jgi:hypothetical protein
MQPAKKKARVSRPVTTECAWHALFIPIGDSNWGHLHVVGLGCGPMVRLVYEHAAYDDDVNSINYSIQLRVV